MEKTFTRNPDLLFTSFLIPVGILYWIFPIVFQIALICSAFVLLASLYIYLKSQFSQENRI